MACLALAQRDDVLDVEAPLGPSLQRLGTVGSRETCDGSFGPGPRLRTPGYRRSEPSLIFVRRRHRFRGRLVAAIQRLTVRFNGVAATIIGAGEGERDTECYVEKEVGLASSARSVTVPLDSSRKHTQAMLGQERRQSVQDVVDQSVLVIVDLIGAGLGDAARPVRPRSR